MLTVRGQRSHGFPIELNERHTCAACALQLTAGTSALPQQQTIRDLAESGKTGGTFTNQVDIGLSADLAD
jgi:ferredoxin